MVFSFACGICLTAARGVSRPPLGAVREKEPETLSNLPDQDHPIADGDQHTISDSAVADFAAHTEHNRFISREQIAPAISSTAASSSSIAASAVAEFTVFSARSRNLGRMNSEQALDFFLNQHLGNQ